MTTSGLLLAVAFALYGNEHGHGAEESHTPQQVQKPHAPAVESDADHPAPASHAVVENAGESSNHADSVQSQSHPTGQHVATESVHAGTATPGHTSDPQGHSTSHGTKKIQRPVHEPPAVPERPKGVLCGQMPAKKFTWRAKQGPITMVGTVVIGPGAQLEIGAGTEIRIGGFDSCPDSGATATNGRSIALVVRGGTLRLDGKSDKPIRFTHLGSGTGYLWNGIRVERAARDQDALLRWIDLSRATKGVSFLAGAGSLEHAVVEDCGIGIASLMGASPSISHSVIARSAITGIASNRSATRILSSLVLDGGDGIRFDGIGLSSIASSCFWGQRGTEIVRGPAGVGGWKHDTLPDRFGNWRRDPVLRGSPEHDRKLAEARQKMASQPWWKPRRLPEPPPGQGPWALSPFSPLVDKVGSRFCSDIDGSKCDIGLWGGPTN